MGPVAVAEKVSLTDFHPKTRKEINKHGPQVVFNNRRNMAISAAKSGSPLAKGLRKEADLIAQIFGL